MAYYFDTTINKRASNEDSFCQMEIRMNHEAPVVSMAVADGMGGMAGGKFFSDLAIRVWFGELQLALMGEEFRDQSLQQQGYMLKNFCEEIYHKLGRILYKEGMDKGLRGGTTMSGVILYWDTFYITNCGDSPIYVMKDGRLYLVSELHNLAAQMVRDGRTTQGSQLYHQNKNLILRYLGGKEGGEPFIRTIPKNDVDLMIIGSDGAFGGLSQERIAQIAAGVSDPKKLLPVLFDEARKTGETDNQTAIVYARDYDYSPGKEEVITEQITDQEAFFNVTKESVPGKSQGLKERLSLWRKSHRE